MALLLSHLRHSLLPALAVMWLGASAYLAAQTANEYEVKAAFLYNFAKFVDWPVSEGAPLCIGVVGRDPFGPALDTLVKGKLINGRVLVTRRYKRIEDVDGCQVVFAGLLDRPHLLLLLERLAGKAVLTVGETPEFCESGGIINFQTQGDKIRFEINRDAADRAQLRLSSKLLSLAVNVWESNQ